MKTVAEQGLEETLNFYNFVQKGGKMEDIKIHSSLSFGGYNWRVLDIQNNTALIITEDIIEQRPYHDAYKDITWAD